MNETPWLMYAAILVWVGLGGYLYLLGKRAARLEARLRRLEFAAGETTRNGRSGDGT